MGLIITVKDDDVAKAQAIAMRGRQVIMPLTMAAARQSVHVHHNRERVFVGFGPDYRENSMPAPGWLSHWWDSFVFPFRLLWDDASKRWTHPIGPREYVGGFRIELPAKLLLRLPLEPSSSIDIFRCRYCGKRHHNQYCSQRPTPQEEAMVKLAMMPRG